MIKYYYKMVIKPSLFLLSISCGWKLGSRVLRNELCVWQTTPCITTGDSNSNLFACECVHMCVCTWVFVSVYMHECVAYCSECRWLELTCMVAIQVLPLLQLCDLREIS